MDLRRPPRLGVLLECDTARLWVDVLASDDRRTDFVEPLLRIDLALEVLGVFLASVVAVARTPTTVSPSLDACHGTLLSLVRRRVEAQRVVLQAVRGDRVR
jgi:hypothetical protein